MCQVRLLHAYVTGVVFVARFLCCISLCTVCCPDRLWIFFRPSRFLGLRAARFPVQSSQSSPLDATSSLFVAELFAASSNGAAKPGRDIQDNLDKRKQRNQTRLTTLPFACIVSPSSFQRQPEQPLSAPARSALRHLRHSFPHVCVTHCSVAGSRHSVDDGTKTCFIHIAHKTFCKSPSRSRLLALRAQTPNRPQNRPQRRVVPSGRRTWCFIARRPQANPDNWAAC